MIIAIDGYSSTGKSSLAKKLAFHFGFLYVDSGAMYRMVALTVLREGWVNDKNELNEGLIKKRLPVMHFAFDQDLDGNNISILNGEVVELDIRTMEVNSIVSKISKNTRVEYNWEKHDISLQNIQARVRSPFIWFIANTNNFLLLATSNRSELSIGYSTMDGDSSGSISPIAGLDKIFIQKL